MMLVQVVVILTSEHEFRIFNLTLFEFSMLIIANTRVHEQSREELRDGFSSIGIMM
jgi:hypothetical protein